MLVIIATLVAVSAAQTDCVYRFGPNELNLYSLKGQRYIYHSNDNHEWMYTPCNDGLSCSHEGQSTQAMIDHSPVGINECFPWAHYDDKVYPFYEARTASWIFNYSNGEPCSDGTQINRTTQISWSCNPEIGQPLLVDVFEYNECNAIFELDWAGACGPPPPPNEHCEFKSGFQSLNLSTVQGERYSLTQINQYGNKYTVEFSACNNSMVCQSAKSNNAISVMADVRDSGSQCSKFLGIWSGDVQPFYDRTIFGEDYWDFFWMNGEECGEGNPLEVLNVRYYCNPWERRLNITAAYENGPCQFRIEIDTSLACTDSQQVFTDHMMKLQ